MDNFVTLSQRLQNRCPQIGYALANQLVNDSWQTLQARKDWAWRRKSATFAPPTLYNTGVVSTNVATGNPTLITGIGTTFTQNMIGRQIRAGGLLYPYYTIVGWLSSTQILIDQPWSGPDILAQAFQILGVYYPVPADFGYFEVAVSIKDGYRLWTQATEAEFAVFDPQRTNQGQTYAAAFRDFSSSYGGVVGPVIPVTSPTDPAPISTTTFGFSYPTNASYIVQVVAGGVSGTATFQWLRAGQTKFQPVQTTDPGAVDLGDGVQVYWPEGVSYVANDLFVINCISMVSAGVPRYELWPAPSFDGYLYPYIYFSKETSLSAMEPTLPPQVANRGELLLEMALEKAATFPGQDIDHPNAYFNLQLANYHRQKYENMMVDFERNDQEIAVSNITWAEWPFAGPWGDSHYMATHAPMLY